MASVVFRTIIPFLLLIGAGLLSRKTGILKSGDPRVLSAYLYYFALPALLFVNTAETSFTSATLRYMAAGVIPVLLALIILVLAHAIVRFTRDLLYLLILSSVFGNIAFFGIPFVMFAFPTREAERLGILAVSAIGIVSVLISITTLELTKLEQATMWTRLRRVLARLCRNPLILAILGGFLAAVARAKIPSVLSSPLHMLGNTTVTVAIFTLGASLYGRKYTNIFYALKLSLLRAVFLPLLALLAVTLMNLPPLQKAVLVLMHAMPVAIAMIIMSERYEFQQDTVASLILVSSIGAILYLNLWLFLIGYR